MDWQAAQYANPGPAPQLEPTDSLNEKMAAVQAFQASANDGDDGDDGTSPDDDGDGDDGTSPDDDEDDEDGQGVVHADPGSVQMLLKYVRPCVDMLVTMSILILLFLSILRRTSSTHGCCCIG